MTLDDIFHTHTPSIESSAEQLSSSGCDINCGFCTPIHFVQVHSMASKNLQFLLLLVLLSLAFVAQLAQGDVVGLKVKVEGGMCEVVMNGTNYPCIEYTVETEDGFLLGLQRIPHGCAGGRNKKEGRRIPVLLQHGLLQGGDNWVLNPPGQSLGFILADEGFDVWIANGRGTRWSHGHASIPKSDRKYWDWTWSELAEYDLPAMLEFVMTTTGSKVFYVGHSQVKPCCGKQILHTCNSCFFSRIFVYVW